MKISFPYTSTEQYLDWLPTYYFDEKNCVDIAAERLNKIADSIENQAKIIMADCGAGPGRVWHLLHPHIHRILAVDPNKNMWRKTPPNNVTYIQEDGLRFMIDYEEHIDLVTFLWSMNYPLLAFFEKYDAEKKQVVQFNWTEGDKLCRETLNQALEARKSSALFLMMFDGDSVEQSFITELWEPVAPFPFNDRHYTRKILEEGLQSFSQKTGATYLKEHLKGSAHYGSFEKAADRLLNFHLKGHFNDDHKTINIVEEFLTKYTYDNEVKIPAGVYLYTILPNGN